MFLPRRRRALLSRVVIESRSGDKQSGMKGEKDERLA
jgi:hypothetical protein